ncbi:MAG TPA: GNAT family N-acetyltransferase [Fimbriimonadaceae bacterium]|nr:GNAT family N-acetyltransferase [Fimbriimonadaceae bacterium]
MQSAGLSIRTLDPGRDYPRVAELRNLFEAEQVTAEQLRQRDVERRPEDFFISLVGEMKGHIVAAGSAYRTLWYEPGKYQIVARVDPARQRKGYGSALLNRLEQAAVSDGATCLEALTSDRGRTGLAFLEARGYRLVAHCYESILSLTDFDPEAFPAPAIPGLRIFPFSETAMDEEARRKLWDVNVETSRDEPHNDPNHRPAFEQFQTSVIEASWFDPEGQFIASLGDEWVGLCAVGEIYKGSLYNLFTGVRRAYRGKGIAKTLKLVAAKFAKESGAPYIRTSNDSRNAPMLAINTWLGYENEPGFYMAQKSV